MEISSAEFVISNTDVKKCPAGIFPEYAFIGRSNVGKSSLINMLTNRKGLVSILIRLDLPTLERPIKAYSEKIPADVRPVLLITNSALDISIFFVIYFFVLLFIINSFIVYNKLSRRLLINSTIIYYKRWSTCFHGTFSVFSFFETLLLILQR